MEPEQIIAEVRLLRADHQPVVPVSPRQIFNDCGGLAKYQIAVSDHRRRSRRMERTVRFRREAGHGIALVANKLIVEAKFLAEPHDAIGLGNPQMVDCDHLTSPQYLKLAGRAHRRFRLKGQPAPHLIWQERLDKSFVDPGQCGAFAHSLMLTGGRMTTSSKM
jgi:hypothetical protein